MCIFPRLMELNSGKDLEKKKKKSLVEEVNMKTGRRQQRCSEGFYRGPGSLPMLTWLNTKRLNVHLVPLFCASFNASAYCRLSKTIVGITWWRKQEVREPFVSKFSDMTINYFQTLLNLQVKLYYACYLRLDSP